MRAKEFIQEYGGFLARGPSGIQYPRGFDPRQSYGGMYQGQRFGRNFEPGDDGSPEPSPIHIHVKKIDQRVAGGMPLEQAVAARAERVGISAERMMKNYRRYKNLHEQIKQTLGLTEEEISCRSDEGITVGIVDSIITSLRLFKGRSQKPNSVQEALLDVADDPDFKYFLKSLSNAEEKNK